MPKASKQAPDQGLFLKHFETGKQAYDSGRLDEAERELVEAYLLRPRDHKILNLLGLLYFKQENYEKAEEVKCTLQSSSCSLFYRRLLWHKAQTASYAPNLKLCTPNGSRRSTAATVSRWIRWRWTI